MKHDYELSLFPARKAAGVVRRYLENMRVKQSPEYLANTIEIMRATAKDGKIVIFKGWPGFTWWSDKELMKKPHDEQAKVARENITFPLACFLV